MQAYEFTSHIGSEGIIQIPKQYLEKIASSVKIILLSNEEPSQKNRSKHFSAIKLKTKGFKFDREFANE